MPWYYAGPDAKPVGPVSLEELQALRTAGTVSAETFVIEHTGTGAADLTWKRYREVFPANPFSAPPLSGFPPIPPAAVPPAAPVYPPTPAAAAPHPLFPSAGSVPQSPYGSTTHYPAAMAPIRRTNSACAWGFGLALAGVCFSLVCGIGLFPALVALILCIVGLVQVSRNRDQAGQGLAISGLILAGFALLVALGVIIWMSSPFLRAHGMTVTEQTSNDSE